MTRAPAPLTSFALFLIVVASSAHGAVLHERIPREDRVDHTRPSESRTLPGQRQRAENLRGSSPGETSSPETFHPDRNTKKPDALPYEEPFRPSIAPWKRLYAYDRIEASYALGVSSRSLSHLELSEPPVDAAKEDLFTADFFLDVARNEPIRVPTVGAGTRVISSQVLLAKNKTTHRLWRDGADNWFLDVDGKGRAHVEWKLAISKDSFGADFGNPSYESLAKEIRAPFPAELRASAKTVADAADASAKASVRDNVVHLVKYFRSFQDSDEPPRGYGNIFLDLALSKKGVCRHRAFAFVLTAQSLNIPSRLVANEAHAWVEVFNGFVWKRIDLGGAGQMLEPSVEGPRHHPLPDPFAWPAQASRGSDLTRPFVAGPGLDGSRQTDSETKPDLSDRTGSEVTLDLDSTTLTRGGPIRVRGAVRAEGLSCQGAPIAIWLRETKSGGRSVMLGGTATNDAGEYVATVVVPQDFPLGDFDLTARTDGTVRCGRGVSP